MEKNMISILLLVACGGAIGAVLRYGMSLVVDSSEFPWATFLVNFIGCFLISLIFFMYNQHPPDNLRYFLFIGVFGAFTTMSTFSLDTLTLILAERFGTAAANVFLNVGLCLGGAYLGRVVALIL